MGICGRYNTSRNIFRLRMRKFLSTKVMKLWKGKRGREANKHNLAASKVDSEHHYITLAQAALKMMKNCRQEVGRDKRETEKKPLRRPFQMRKHHLPWSYYTQDYILRYKNVSKCQAGALKVLV